MTAINRELRLQWVKAHHNRTVNDYTLSRFTNVYICCLIHGGGVRICHQQHKLGSILRCFNSSGWKRWCDGGGNIFLADIRQLNTK